MSSLEPTAEYLAMAEAIEMCDFLWRSCMAPGIVKNPSPFKSGMSPEKFLMHIKILRYEIEKRRPIVNDDPRLGDLSSEIYETLDEVDVY